MTENKEHVQCPCIEAKPEPHRTFNKGFLTPYQQQSLKNQERIIQLLESIDGWLESEYGHH